MSSSKIYTTLPGLKIVRAGGGEMELFLDHTNSSSLRGFTKIFHREKYGGMSFEYYVGNGFQIWRSGYLMHEIIKCLTTGDIRLMELHLPLAGSALTWWDGKQENHLRPLQFDLQHTFGVNSGTIFQPGVNCGTLDIHYATEFLQTFVEKYPVLYEFLEHVNAEERASLLQRAVRFMSPAMLRIVDELLHYPGTPDMMELFYEQQVTLLLEIVLARAMDLKHDFSNKRDIDATVAVRSLIENNPGQAFTAAELSKFSGVDVTRLHKSFKELHGVTLFEFGQGRRLDYGKQLLLDTRLTLQEIGEQCGYAERSNFTAAFTKKFGFSPAQFRGIKKMT